MTTEIKLNLNDPDATVALLKDTARYASSDGWDHKSAQHAHWPACQVVVTDEMVDIIATAIGSAAGAYGKPYRQEARAALEAALRAGDPLVITQRAADVLWMLLGSMLGAAVAVGLMVHRFVRAGRRL